MPFELDTPTTAKLTDIIVLSDKDRAPETNKEGGSVVVKFRTESPDVSAKVHGDLALLKTREFPITLVAPEVVQQDIEAP